MSLNAALDRVGKEFIARRPLSRFIQIDRLVTLLTGTGPGTTAPFYLPHARYTLFMSYDPPAAVQSVSLIDRSGRGSPDWTSIDATAGEVIAPLVQDELTAGTYQFRIEATPTCWMAQLVLNSMLSWEAAPRPFRRSSSLPEPIMLGTGKNPDFRIEQTGMYGTDLRLGDFAPHIASRRLPQAFCPFSLSLRAADNHHHHLARGTEHDASWPSWVCLGAGDWKVLVETDCEWELVIRPMVGPSGGGAYWF